MWAVLGRGLGVDGAVEGELGSERELGTFPTSICGKLRPGLMVQKGYNFLRTTELGYGNWNQAQSEFKAPSPASEATSSLLSCECPAQPVTSISAPKVRLTQGTPQLILQLALWTPSFTGASEVEEVGTVQTLNGAPESGRSPAG